LGEVIAIQGRYESHAQQQMRTMQSMQHVPTAGRGHGDRALT
jgi:hypothetical protein